eukprot:CAMPEP_0201282502 /NCGR_PEP_ID=MMETSP1317-20130820/5799_1 /ASSEMBLY_ACC=CAM_ASM_000770 /TAXON_ID=187299 /ORGANISM="Undescribed Undescribed, Strain Undescribed" /LENGTH=99 /DNA_ID=CAMNT_0047595339 /DNA_START=151 /DNA_END=451 /DNA_ORIENTATION=+
MYASRRETEGGGVRTEVCTRLDRELGGTTVDTLGDSEGEANAGVGRFGRQGAAGGGTPQGGGTIPVANNAVSDTSVLRAVTVPSWGRGNAFSDVSVVIE